MSIVMIDLELRVRFKGCLLPNDDETLDIDLRLGDLKSLHIIFGSITVVTKDGKVYVPEKSYPRIQDFCDEVGIQYTEDPIDISKLTDA